MLMDCGAKNGNVSTDDKIVMGKNSCTPTYITKIFFLSFFLPSLLFSFFLTIDPGPRQKVAEIIRDVFQTEMSTDVFRNAICRAQILNTAEARNIYRILKRRH